jgi:hypothetical protein
MNFKNPKFIAQAPDLKGVNGQNELHALPPPPIPSAQKKFVPDSVEVPSLSSDHGL